MVTQAAEVHKGVGAIPLHGDDAQVTAKVASVASTNR